MEAVLGSAPGDLVAYYEAGTFPNYPGSRIRCLPFEAAKLYTQQILQIPVAARLGLWVLDDANDSNPFAYISKGPCAGMVVHVRHDDDWEVAFPSFRRFLAAMVDAGTRGLAIDEVAREPINAALDPAIFELARDGSDDATALIVAYLPAAALLQKATKEILVAHDDFFVREAFGEFVSENPSAEDLGLAQQLAADRHAQVARAGMGALRAVKRAMHGS